MAENRLIVRVKQGEELNLGFTIKQNNNIMDLSDYSISFKVKYSPLESSKTIIDKTITTISDINDIGNINYPQQGQFVVHLNKKDTLYPVNDYYLVISLVADYLDNIISSSPCTTATFSICEQ